ncbi:hypothetical protein C7405_103592 [Paraburkholderia caballeronis]|nr:hypothetical protein C7405_103592 [Paraburkholderia caballeronis]
MLSLAPIIGLFWNYPSHTPSRFWEIILISWYQVNVEMGHRLARGNTIIDADVIGVGLILLVESTFCAVN